MRTDRSTALDFLLGVAADHDAPSALRLSAASAVAPYLATRKKPVAASGDTSDEALRLRLFGEAVECLTLVELEALEAAMLRARAASEPSSPVSESLHPSGSNVAK